MTSKNESSILEISARTSTKILLLIIPAQKPIRQAQEHSLDSVEESILITPNIYDKTAKWVKSTTMMMKQLIGVYHMRMMIGNIT